MLLGAKKEASSIKWVKIHTKCWMQYFMITYDMEINESEHNLSTINFSTKIIFTSGSLSSVIPRE